MDVEAKICGLSTSETVDAAVAGGARWVGFVTYPRSPRHISTETLRALAARVPKTVGRVGLFVDADDALLDERLAAGALDLLQLHGNESPERVAAIRARSTDSLNTATAMATTTLMLVIPLVPGL